MRKKNNRKMRIDVQQFIVKEEYKFHDYNTQQIKYVFF